MRLTVIIQQDEDGRFNASCPELVGCASWGLTYEDALKNIKEAIELNTALINHQVTGLIQALMNISRRDFMIPIGMLGIILLS